MKPDLWSLYEQMLRSRRFEELTAQLWKQGMISGEMHLGVGEEAIVAGILAHLKEGDAMALDYRSTPPMVMRGVGPELLLREFLGRQDGLCGGMGGHMHLFSPDHLAGSSGIVGSPGPMAAGFALAAQMLRPGNVAVAFFGEGAINQGMMLEALNLAVVWKLPALFVCKDNGWAILTRSQSVTGGDILSRARGFGLYILEVDGGDVEAVWRCAREAMARIRHGGSPVFILATCDHLEGHFLGDPFLRFFRAPLEVMRRFILPTVRSFLGRRGAGIRLRLGGLARFIKTMRQGLRQVWRGYDPLIAARHKLRHDPERLRALEAGVEREMELILNNVCLSDVPGGGK